MNIAISLMTLHPAFVGHLFSGCLLYYIYIVLMQRCCEQGMFIEYIISCKYSYVNDEMAWLSFHDLRSH